MFEIVIERLKADVVDLQALDLALCSDADVLELLRSLETVTNQLASVDHAMVNEIDSRGLARERGCSSTAVLLAQMLRVNPQEASARVRAAAELGPRRSLTGETLPPIFDATAGACAEGRVSPRHAAIITNLIKTLPDAVAAEHDLSVESFLLAHAQRLNPAQLAKVARHLKDTLDQDGTLAADTDRRRLRELSVHQRADGTVTGSFTLEPIAGEALLTVLDSLSVPQPATDGARDPRTAGQRRADALRDAMLMLLRTDLLPNAGGVAATIVLTMSVEQYEQRRGLAKTGHGALIPVPTALTLVGDAQSMAVINGVDARIEAYSCTQRLFTGRQRLAMASRDHGCSFPGCTRPPPWCEAHHITDYALSGQTRVDDGTLLCGFHHREHELLGWQCTMRDGVPHWTAPAWLDPTQTPVRNTAHNPQEHLSPVP